MNGSTLAPSRAARDLAAADRLVLPLLPYAEALRRARHEETWALRKVCFWGVVVALCLYLWASGGGYAPAVSPNERLGLAALALVFIAGVPRLLAARASSRDLAPRWAPRVQATHQQVQDVIAWASACPDVAYAWEQWSQASAPLSLHRYRLCRAVAHAIAPVGAQRARFDRREGLRKGV